MMSRDKINNLWKEADMGEYIRVNKADGSLPSVEEFERMIQKNAN